MAQLPGAGWHDARVLAGNESHEDAGVFRLTPDIALVQTIDFFTPVVDDPQTFGRIAAANSLSDVYAMGGEAITALNLLATPAGVLDPAVVASMLEGGQAVMKEASCSIIGGHSIDDPEPKMGYAVTGIVHPDHIWRNHTAQPGDVVYLSKPVGTGVVVKAIKDGLAEPEATQAAIAMMATTNRAAKEAIRAVGDPSACTDVTGFGLLGHLWEMAQGAGVKIVLERAAVPILPQALPLALADRFPAGSRRNWEYVSTHVVLNERPDALDYLLADAVTSGGLLFSVPVADSGRVESEFAARGLNLWRIGSVYAGSAQIRIE